LISLDISQNDSIGIIDLKPSPFAGYDIGMHLFDDVSVVPPLQGIVVRILNTVSRMRFCANLVPILPDAAAVKTANVQNFEELVLAKNPEKLDSSSRVIG